MFQTNDVRLRIILFTVILIVSSSYLEAQKPDDDWRLIKEDKENNIIIYYRTLESGNTEFKGITYIYSSLNSFVALIEDFDKMPEWAYRTEKVEKLKGYRFYQKLKENKTGATFHWKKDEGVYTERFGPNEESIDASVLTLRFFIQDNEKCSIREISKIYNDFIKNKEIQSQFHKSRELFNQVLNSMSFFNLHGKRYSRNEIFEIIIYGGLAHANKTKKKIFDEWMKNPLIKDLLLNEFVYILTNLINFLEYIKNLNDKVIQDYQKK